MSDYNNISEIYKYKFKRNRLDFPLDFLKDVMRGVFRIFQSENILSELKSGPAALYNRFFGTSGRQHIYNVLVLVADLETNVGAACIELLNNEVPELLKQFNYRHNFSIFDDNIFSYDYSDELFDNHINQFECPAIERVSNSSHDESIILDANLDNEEQIITQINPEYLMQISLSSNDLDSATYCNQLTLTQKSIDSSESINILNIKPFNLESCDIPGFTEPSISDTSCEWGDKENAHSNYESDQDDSDFKSQNSAQSLPKPIQREINQLHILGVPYAYQNITQSSHEEFKILRSNPNLRKSQIAAMVTARRRYINRKAATRCRTQKVQQKDQLNLELRKLEDKLMKTKISLTKAYQERNQRKECLRELQVKLVSRLETVDGKRLSPKKWLPDVIDSARSIVVREKTTN